MQLGLGKSCLKIITFYTNVFLKKIPNETKNKHAIHQFSIPQLKIIELKYYHL